MGFWDGFGEVVPGSISIDFVTGSVLNQSTSVVTAVLTVTNSTATQIAATAATAGVTVTALAVGSPTLETWTADAANSTAVTQARTLV